MIPNSPGTAALLLLFANTALASEQTVELPVPPVSTADFYDNGEPDPKKIELGRLLFFDKILSGNRNISCATCHHPKKGTTDRLALPVGEGGIGLAKHRRIESMPVLARVPRNSQALYFLGAKEFKRLFHDGRVEVDKNKNWPSGFWTPARRKLPVGLDNVLAAQAMFPVLSAVEMAGHKGENEIATAAALGRLDGPSGAWGLLTRRLQRIPDYVAGFKAAFPQVKNATDNTFVHAANAIAAFESTAFRADGSPFDQYLRSRQLGVLSRAAQRGLRLFYGEAGCSACHAGKFQTDHRFHAIAMPQIGPGKGDGDDQSYWQATGFGEGLEDFGRGHVTNRAADRYRFRTPSLRNVELTGPWGHAGAYNTLEDVVRHHLQPVASLQRYRLQPGALVDIGNPIESTASGSLSIFKPINPNRLSDYHLRDGWVQSRSRLRAAIARANELTPQTRTDRDVEALVAFLKTLTDPRSRNQGDLVPERVPSGLPVAD